MDKRSLYAEYFLALGYISDMLGLEKKGQGLTKDRLHQSIKKSLGIESIKELSYEQMHKLNELLYDFFPIGIIENLNKILINYIMIILETKLKEAEANIKAKQDIINELKVRLEAQEAIIEELESAIGNKQMLLDDLSERIENEQ